MASHVRLAALASVINRALALDPLASARLQTLSGQCLRIECSEPPLDIVIDITGNGIALRTAQAAAGEPVHAHLRGRLSDFVKLLGADDKAAAIINSDLHLHGNSQLLQQLADILQPIDLDWEYHLARLIGDLPAHLLGKLGRDSWHWLQQSRPVFARHLQEFVLEEAALSPGRAELDAFVDDVQALMLRSERLAARIARLRDSLPQDRP